VGIHLAEQAAVFVEAMIVGAVFGIVYDVFRIGRVAFRTPAIIVFAEDILFFAVCAVITFFFGLTVIDGALRLFVLLGELCGGILYPVTVGKLVLAVSTRIIEAIRAFFRFVIRKILVPAWALLLRVAALMLRPMMFFYKILKKTLQKAKIRLKTGSRLLYNHIKARSVVIKAQVKNRAKAIGTAYEEARRKKAGKARPKKFNIASLRFGGLRHLRGGAAKHADGNRRPQAAARGHAQKQRGPAHDQQRPHAQHRGRG
jgi:spore cortex biosynthesis protein YabQ